MIEFRVVPNFLKCKPWRNLLSVGSKSIFGYGGEVLKNIYTKISLHFSPIRGIYTFSKSGQQLMDKTNSVFIQ
jgi:hypothetical protein